MMLIDETFFHGEIHIEGLISCPGVPSMTQDAVRDELMGLISLYELQFYKEALGEENAREFVNYLGRKENPTEDDGKWIELEKMLVEEMDGRKYSPIAYYTFFFYLRKNQAEATPLGVTEANSSNPVVSPRGKMINAWNNMVHINKYLSDWLYMNKEKYGGYHFSCDLLEDINMLGI